jgi:hypothetical protein
VTRNLRTTHFAPETTSENSIVQEILTAKCNRYLRSDSHWGTVSERTVEKQTPGGVGANVVQRS